jgi:hypothetical protein
VPSINPDSSYKFFINKKSDFKSCEILAVAIRALPSWLRLNSNWFFLRLKLLIDFFNLERFLISANMEFSVNFWDLLSCYLILVRWTRILPKIPVDTEFIFIFVRAISLFSNSLKLYCYKIFSLNSISSYLSRSRR